MPLAISSCFCCFPKLRNSGLRERLVGQTNNAAGAATDAAAEQQQQPATAAPNQSGASLQRLLAHGISSSCPDLRLLEEHATQQQQQQKQMSQQEAKQSSKSTNSKPVVKPPGSSETEQTSSRNAPSTAKALQKAQGQQIELKPAAANPFLGVQHITADRGFVKARPGAA